MSGNSPTRENPPAYCEINSSGWRFPLSSDIDRTTQAIIGLQAELRNLSGATVCCSLITAKVKPIVNKCISDYEAIVRRTQRQVITAKVYSLCQFELIQRLHEEGVQEKDIILELEFIIRKIPTISLDLSFDAIKSGLRVSLTEIEKVQRLTSSSPTPETAGQGVEILEAEISENQLAIRQELTSDSALLNVQEDSAARGVLALPVAAFGVFIYNLVSLLELTKAARLEDAVLRGLFWTLRRLGIPQEKAKRVWALVAGSQKARLDLLKTSLTSVLSTMSRVEPEFENLTRINDAVRGMLTGYLEYLKDSPRRTPIEDAVQWEALVCQASDFQQLSESMAKFTRHINRARGSKINV